MKDNYKAQALKFYARNEEEATTFQRRAFQLGYKWADGKTTIDVEARCFYLDEDGDLFYTTREKDFLDNYSKQITLEEFLAPQRGEMVEVRDSPFDDWESMEFVCDLGYNFHTRYVVKGSVVRSAEIYKQMRLIKREEPIGMFKGLQASIDLLEQAIEGLKKLKR